MKPVSLVLIVGVLTCAWASCAATNPTVRVATAQAAGRVVDFRLTNSAAVLARVEKNLEALEVIVHKAGAEKCDVLALPEDTAGLLNWVGVNETLAK